MTCTPLNRTATADESNPTTSTIPSVTGLNVAVVGQGPIGLLFDACLSHLGAARIIEMLAPLESLGPRMQPTRLLLELARSGGRFYCERVATP